MGLLDGQYHLVRGVKKLSRVGAAATYLVGAVATYLVGAAASYQVQAENKANSAQLSWSLATNVQNTATSC